MRAVRQRGTEQELALRRQLFEKGLRYRLHVRSEGTSIDIAFPGLKLAVFCDGCFWHGCPKHATSARRNKEWWRLKIEGNVARDQRLRRRLKKAGWVVLRVWGHESPSAAAKRIFARVKALRET